MSSGFTPTRPFSEVPAGPRACCGPAATSCSGGTSVWRIFPVACGSGATISSLEEAKRILESCDLDSTKW